MASSPREANGDFDRASHIQTADQLARLLDTATDDTWLRLEGTTRGTLSGLVGASSVLAAVTVLARQPVRDFQHARKRLSAIAWLSDNWAKRHV